MKALRSVATKHPLWFALAATLVWFLLSLVLTGVVTYGLSLLVASLLTLQTFVISVWWGALVLTGGSIWPAVMLHFVVNAAVAVQGISLPAVELELLAYTRVLLFSLPFGALGMGLLWRAARPLTLSKATSR